MPSFRIDITNKANTTTYQALPMADVISWKFSEVLSAVGRFEMVIPLDGVKSDQVQRERYLRIYETSSGDSEWFVGIIKGVEREDDSIGPTLRCKGPCKLHELEIARTGNLDVFEWGWVSPVFFARDSDSAAFANAIDGNPGTSDTFYYPASNWLYWGYYQPMRAARWDVGGGSFSDVGAAQVQGFYQGGFWSDVTSLSDGTESGGDTLAVDGDMTWDDLTNLQYKETHNDLLLHWMRHRFSGAGAITGFVVNELEVETRVATTAGLSTIMGAVSGWSLDVTGNLTTATPFLHSFKNETILAALARVNKYTGEQFTRKLGAREIYWHRTTLGPYKLTATSDAPAIPQPANTAYLTKIKETEVPIQATRLYVTGAGLGSGIITMALADTSEVSLPSGYTFDAVNSVLINTTVESALGYTIEAHLELKTMATIGSSGQSVQASNMLLRAAITQLEYMSDNTRLRYDISVAGVQDRIRPYDQVIIDHDRTRSGVQILGVNVQLPVLSITYSMGADGKLKTDIELGNKDKAPKLDDGVNFIASRLKIGEYSAHNRQPMSAIDVDGSTGGNGLITSLIPSGTYLTPSDLATHTADADAHHNQVHDILGGDHTITGAAGGVLGLPSANTIGIITPVSDGDATPDTILKTDSSGDLVVTDLIFTTELRRGAAGTHTKFNSSQSRMGGASEANFDINHSSSTILGNFGDNTNTSTAGFYILGTGIVFGDINSYGTGGTSSAFMNVSMNAETKGLYFGLISGTYIAPVLMGGIDIRGIPFVSNNITAGWETPLFIHGHDGIRLVDDSGYILDSRNSSEPYWYRHFTPDLTLTRDIGTAVRQWRSLYTGEIRAQLFTEDWSVLIGGRFIVPHAQGKLVSALTVSTSTIDIGVSLQAGDFLLLQGLDSGGLPIVEVVTVGTLVSGTEYNITRDTDGSGANEWEADQVVWNYGQDGDGHILMDAQGANTKMSVFRQGATYSAQTETFRAGDLNGVAGISSSVWGFWSGDGSDNYILYRSDTNLLVTSGTIYAQDGRFDGFVELGTGGGLYQGTGTPASPQTGLKISNQSGVGILETFESGTRQLLINTSGQLIAGAGNETRMDASGLQIRNNTTTTGTNDPTNIAFIRESTGDVLGTVHGYHNGLTGINEAYTMRLILNSIGGGNDTTIDMTEFSTGNQSSIILTSDAISLIGSVSGISAAGDLSVTGKIDTLDDLSVGGEIVNDLGASVVFGEPITYSGSNAEWITMGNWQTPTLLNSWATYVSGTTYHIRYRRTPWNSVQLAGLLDPSAATAGTPFNLPAGYRPSRVMVPMTAGFTGATRQDVQLTVQTNGDVGIGGYSTTWTWVSLDGVEYPLNAP